MNENAPYNIPKAPGRWRAITLALVMHVALFLFFWVGIRWQSETPLTVEAEIWDPQYKEAAPLPTPPQPEPQPEVPQPRPQPQPEPQPEPRPVPPKVIDEPKVEKPDIALEKEKKRKEELDKQKAEQLKAQKERDKKEEAEKQKAEKDRADKEKTEREKKEKLEADKLKKAKEAKEEKQKEDDARKKADAEKQAVEKKKQAADAKASEARRQDDLKRMMGQATSSTGGTGTAEKSQGPKGTPDYANKLRAKIRANTVFDVPGDISGNPAVEYTVELFPDGTVRSVRNVKQSGVPGFDDAVRQAIMKSQPFPADKDGKVPSSFTFTHYPKDQ